MEKEQLGKEETLNRVEVEEGNASKEIRRRNERSKNSKFDEHQKLSDLSGFENLKAMVEAEAFLRRKRRNRKKSKRNIELCAQKHVKIDAEEGNKQLAEDEALKMVPISEMNKPQNILIYAAKEDEVGSSVKAVQTTKATGGYHGLNSFEVIDICSSPSEDDESVSDVSLGRRVEDMGKVVQTTKAVVEDGMNSAELEVIDLFSSSSEDDGSVSGVSLGRSVEETVKAMHPTKATGADDWGNPVEVMDLLSSLSEDDKPISEVSVSRNAEDTLTVRPVEREKKKKRRRKKRKVIKAKDTIDNITKGNDAKDNMVLRMLLQKPRYFDPFDWNMETCSNCGQESHKTACCNARKRKKPCFLCGSLKHIWKYCRKV